jgi:hypothetical protein
MKKREERKEVCTTLGEGEKIQSDVGEGEKSETMVKNKVEGGRREKVREHVRMGKVKVRDGGGECGIGDVMGVRELGMRKAIPVYEGIPNSWDPVIARIKCRLSEWKSRNFVLWGVT